MPHLTISLISVGQLRGDSGCRVSLFERSFVLHLGLLVIARGARVGTWYPLYVVQARDGLVSISLQPCEEQETRTVSLADSTQDALQVEHSSELVVQESMDDRHVEQFCSTCPRTQ